MLPRKDQNLDRGLTTFVVRAIGVVRNGISERQTVWEEVGSELVLDDRYTQALAGLDEFSHVIVLFWLHLSDPWVPGTTSSEG